MTTIEKLIKDGFKIKPINESKYQVFNCFRFPDGDCIVLIIENIDDRWIIHDNGHTYSHIGILFEAEHNLFPYKYLQYISNVFEEYGIKDDSGKLSKDFTQSDDFYSFIQGILEVIVLISYREQLI